MKTDSRNVLLFFLVVENSFSGFYQFIEYNRQHGQGKDKQPIRRRQCLNTEKMVENRYMSDSHLDGNPGNNGCQQIFVGKDSYFENAPVCVSQVETVEQLGNSQCHESECLRINERFPGNIAEVDGKNRHRA